MELLHRFTRKDFRIDTFRAGGPGGQHQNKTDSAVRITHLETGLSAEARESRSQHINKATAFRRLAARMKLYYAELYRKPKNRVTETVRTYHAVDNRVKDHASGFQQSFDEATDDLGEMIDARRQALQQDE